MCENANSTSIDSHPEDWDKSLISEGNQPTQTSNNTTHQSHNVSAPQNSVVFPAVEGNSDASSRSRVERSSCASAQGKRTLSELLKLHAEKGTDCRLSPEEASRLGDVLGEWINASSSPYEGEDDFFKSHDDIGLLPRRNFINTNRPRGQSECANSRPSSAVGFAA